MPLIISDSSTLIHLASIGQLDLLKDFYETITIPPAIWTEVVTEGKGRAGATEVEEAYKTGWIKILALEDNHFLRLLKREMNDGEAEVTALAVERQAVGELD